MRTEHKGRHNTSAASAGGELGGRSISAVCHLQLSPISLELPTMDGGSLQLRLHRGGIYCALLTPATCLASSDDSSSSDRSSLATLKKTMLRELETTWRTTYRTRMRQMRKYQNRLMHWRRKIGVKICHFILRVSDARVWTCSQRIDVPSDHPLVVQRAEPLALVLAAGQLKLITQAYGMRLN